MKLAVFLVLLVTLLAIPAVAIDWITNPINNHRYATVEGFPWETAEANAVALGGHLVTIRSAEENLWILSNVVQPVTSAPVWIGFHQLPGSIEPAGGWVWVSGEPIIYTNWAAGEPNQYRGYTEDWAEMYSIDPPRGYWNDVNLTMTRARYGVVEVVPEPTSLAALGCGLPALLLTKRRSKR